jgi:hypothetical protein
VAARAGWDFLGDDVALIRATPGGRPTVLAFPDEIDLVPGAERFFPALAPMLAERRPSAAGKYSFDPAEVGARVAWSAMPVLLVLPRIVDHGPASLRRLTIDEALLALVPNIVRTERAASQCHFDALGDLVRSTIAFALEFADPLAAPALLREALQGGTSF